MSEHFLFDLDGTIVDSAPGITHCVAEALRELTGSAPPAASLVPWIGAPLREVFERLLPGAASAEVDRAIALYREGFDRVGMQMGRAYAGMGETLEALRARGTRLHLCTVKLQPVAEQVVSHLGLGPAFETVFGARPEAGIAGKRDVLAHAISTAQIAATRATLVGDRHHDVDAARALGVRAVAVAWGYGDLEELRAASAIVRRPAELLDLPARDV